jgi:hypothetical protein
VKEESGSQAEIPVLVIRICIVRGPLGATVPGETDRMLTSEVWPKMLPAMKREHKESGR